LQADTLPAVIMLDHQVDLSYSIILAVDRRSCC